MSSSTFAEIQLELRTRIFPNRALDHGWESLVGALYERYPALDSSRNLFIRINNGLGDVVCTLGLMRAWKHHYSARHVIGIANRSTAEARSLFPGALDYVLEVDAEPLCNEYRGGSVFGVLHRPTKPYVFNGLLEPWFTRMEIPYLDRYRLGLQLPPWAAFTPPRVDHTSNMVDMTAVRALENAILLAPFARTIPGPPKSIWIAIAEALSNKGFKVFTNMSNTVNTGVARNDGGIGDDLNPGEPIAGTAPLLCNLSTLLAAAPLMKGVVTTNSGVAWLLGNAVSKMLVLHSPSKLTVANSELHGFKSKSIIEIDRIDKSFPWANGIKDVVFPEQNSIDALPAHFSD